MIDKVILFYPRVKSHNYNLNKYFSNFKLHEVFSSSPAPRQMNSAGSVSIIVNPISVTLPKAHRDDKKILTLNTMLLEALKYREVEAIEKWVNRTFLELFVNLLLINKDTT